MNSEMFTETNWRKQMSSFTEQATALANQIEERLVELRLNDANFAALLSEAERLVTDASVEGLHLAHPQVVFQGEGVSLRVMLMNGKPLPIATAWVRVPRSWMTGIRS